MRRLPLFAPVLIVLTFAATAAPAGAAVAKKKCTIVAKPGQRVIHGTPKADVICARSGGSKIIWGAGGNDTIYTGAVGSVVHGGAGADTIISGSGRDIINGGPGNDTLIAQNGNDFLAGNAGNDLLEGGAGNDELNGGAGNDILEPGIGDNTCDGGTGDNQLGAWCDDSGPELESLSVNTNSVDTSTGPQTVTFTMEITDNLSGFAEGQVRIGYGAGSSGAFLGNRISGDDLDGIYQASVTMPQNIAAGEYAILVTLYDNQGNRSVFPDWKLQPLGFPYQIDQTGQGDGTPPVMSDFSLSGPTSFDTSAGPQTIDLHLHATDDSSGVAKFQVIYQLDDANVPGTPLVMAFATADSTRVSGDDLDGDYVIPVTFNQGVHTGTWSLQTVIATDNVGNEAGPGAAWPFSSAFDVQQVGPDDTLGPVFNSVTVTPQTVDESTTGTIVDVAMDITDAGGSGVAGYSCSWQSPNGQKSIATYGNSPPAADGLYHMNLFIGPNSLEPGVWTGSCAAYDNVNNNSVTFAAPPITIE